MSDGSNSFKCILEPYKTVGAQDLLKIGYQYYGHLRRRGKRENLLASFSSLSLKWRQKFVILSQGCVYCYGSEFSKSPSAAFSLSVYESVKEIGDQDKMLHCFEVRHEDCNKPPQTFACETNEKRKEWIAHIRESIEQSHKFSQGSLHSDGGGSDEGISVKPPITTKRKTVRDLPPLPKIPSDAEMRPSNSPREVRTKKPESEYDFDDDYEEDLKDDLKEDECYNDIDDSTFNQPLPASPKSRHQPVPASPKARHPPGFRVQLPGLADLNTGRQSVSNKPSSPTDRPPVPLPISTSKSKRQSLTYEDTEPTKPLVAKKPLRPQVFTPASYLFDSNNKDRAREMLESRPAGTFLLRNGRQDANKKVLSVQTSLGVKEFQIQQKGSKVTLNNNELFDDLEKLLLHYHENDLPKNEYSQKLLKGYK